MKKNVMMAGAAMVVTVAGMSAAQAQAQALSGLQTTVYGIADAQAEYVNATGGAVPAQDKPARYRISNVSSEFGIKASLPLSNGMTALAQYTTGISVDSGNTSASAGMFGSAKDTFVGLAIPKVGTIKLGRMTAAARWNSGTADFSPMGAGLQDNQGMLSGASGQSATGPQFNIRFDNTLGFESASFNGLSVRAYFSGNENKSATGTPTSPHLDDKSWSLGMQYVTGPFDLRASLEQRNDKGTLNASTDHNTRDKDFRFGLRYTLPTGTILGFGYDHMELTDANATGTAKARLAKNGKVISAKHVFGQHVVYGGYGIGSNVSCSHGNSTACNGDDTGATNGVIAYQYVLDKQMLFEMFATYVKNDARGKYDFDSGGIGPAAGATSRAVGAGFRFAF
jgi:predicted porin